MSFVTESNEAIEELAAMVQSGQAKVESIARHNERRYLIITDYERCCVHHIPLSWVAAESDALCARFGYRDELTN